MSGLVREIISSLLPTTYYPRKLKWLNQNTYESTRLSYWQHFCMILGKLLGRGDFKILDNGQQPKFSSTFISAYKNVFSQIADVSLLQELVQKHHENSKAFPPEFLVQSIADAHLRTLATLVSKADNLASSERGESSEQYQDYKATVGKNLILERGLEH